MRPNDGIEEIGISLDGIIGLEEKTGRDSGSSIYIPAQYMKTNIFQEIMHMVINKVKLLQTPYLFWYKISSAQAGIPCE